MTEQESPDTQPDLLPLPVPWPPGEKVSMVVYPQAGIADEANTPVKFSGGVGAALQRARLGDRGLMDTDRPGDSELMAALANSATRFDLPRRWPLNSEKIIHPLALNS